MIVMAYFPFNLALVLQIVTTGTVVVGACIGIFQLFRIKMAMTVEFLRHFNGEMTSEEHRKVRRSIFKDTPHPRKEKDNHQIWLQDIAKRKRSEQNRLIDDELVKFDTIALSFKEAKMNEDFVLSPNSRIRSD